MSKIGEENQDDEEKIIKKSEETQGVDDSIMVVEESFYDDMVSPGRSPGRKQNKSKELYQPTSRIINNLNKIRLTNDMGQVRLTPKMREKENFYNIHNKRLV